MVKSTYLPAGGLLSWALVSKPTQEMLLKVTPSSVSNYFTSFNYEAGVTPLTSYYWPLGLCSLYLLSVYALKAFMKNRQPYDLYNLRVVHNVILCFGSLLMFVGCLKETIAVFQRGGAETLLCNSTKTEFTDNNMLFWIYMFYLSKYYEFLDTYIIILRKKPLIFLHVFHHFITAILVWVGLEGNLPPQWITLLLNTLVHVFMYWYYLVQTLGSDVWWKKYVTTGQIIQFIIDLAVISSWFLYRDVWGYECSGNVYAVFFAQLILGYFLFLFSQFFLRTYLSGKKTDKKTEKKE